ncbi:MAG: hypothetical protein ABH882_02070 [Candidatus Omnitrophota bacterium]|nr:hypothetical protein [Candidatus Omnitrophota bacterium]MBU1929564.1 hypothetical protein [Candidatus Omnitrophota bacterium]MBU2035744.1 hypothetical protein [Candidatus Omnitrophota bacterium]MBU2221779.1 hypothetical protein [Candidatus Omnitrophota bacterium]
MKKRRGQSILEYVIIFAAVVAAVILGARTLIKPAVEQGMKDTASAMNTATGKLTNIGQ